MVIDIPKQRRGPMYDFDEVWNEIHNKLLNYIRSRVSDHYDAEDILQNVFLKVFNNFSFIRLLKYNNRFL